MTNEEAIEFGNMWLELQEDSKDSSTYTFVQMAIKALEQEPKTGHWIRVTDKTGHLVWECDRCGWQQRFNTNFCPDCGGRMVEPLKSGE